ncbi:AMP-binding protein [Streptomyces sp. 5.8]|uniref:AMP-binding protein n=1 Tax=Streptomyces sp. 5.8 TaxID=3406571 RepID=UPI003BB7DB8B
MRPELSHLEQRGDEAPSASEGLPDLVRRLARQRPDAQAVTGPTPLTYSTVMDMADAVAARLLEAGVAPGDVVGVCSSRSHQVPSLVLGIMRSRAVYLPLDPLYPDALLAVMARAADVRAVIVDQDAAGRVPPGHRCLSAVELLSPLSGCLPLAPIDPCSGAYGMFTSGSTGDPKGVLLGHGGLADYAGALPRRVGLGAGDRCLGVAPLGFSSAMRQLLVPLAVGATVVVPTDGQVRTPWEFADLVHEELVSHLDVTPSFWRALLDALPEDDARRMLAGVRRVLFASEPLDGHLAHHTRRLAPHVRLWNMYGCTETTGIVTAYEVTGSEPEDAAVPIGTALDHVTVSLAPAFSDTEHPEGQIVVTGRAVALGRLGSGAGSGLGAAVRRLETGDHAEQSTAGLVWRGRADRMVKVRGMRVAAESVEQQLIAHDHVQRAAVVAASDRGLVCTVEPAHGPSGPDPRQVIAWLRNRVPAHMVPAEITVTTHWPLLPNGKTDHQQLAGRYFEDNHAGGEADADHR